MHNDGCDYNALYSIKYFLLPGDTDVRLSYSYVVQITLSKVDICMHVHTYHSLYYERHGLLNIESLTVWYT